MNSIKSRIRRNTFPKLNRLLKKKEFRKVTQSTTRSVQYCIIAQWTKNYHDRCKLGIIASKRYGKAHVRNRFKRIVREAFRLSKDSFPPGFDLVIKPRTKAKTARSTDISDELQKIRQIMTEKSGEEASFPDKI